MPELQSIEDLQEAEYNPRDIKGAHLEGLKVSLQEFGDISGIVWNKRTGRLVCGHQRIKALRSKYGEVLKLSDGHVECPDGSLFSVRVVDWPAEKEKAANIAANSPTVQGEFDTGLEGMLAELDEQLPDLYEALMFDDLMAGSTVDGKVTQDMGNSDRELGEIPVTPELLEANNYLLFKFDNEMDWNVAVAGFGIRAVKTEDTREGYARIGVGRVVDGRKLVALIGKADNDS